MTGVLILFALFVALGAVMGAAARECQLTEGDIADRARRIELERHNRARK